MADKFLLEENPNFNVWVTSKDPGLRVYYSKMNMMSNEALAYCDGFRGMLHSTEIEVQPLLRMVFELDEGIEWARLGTHELAIRKSTLAEWENDEKTGIHDKIMGLLWDGTLFVTNLEQFYALPDDRPDVPYKERSKESK